MQTFPAKYKARRTLPTQILNLSLRFHEFETMIGIFYETGSGVLYNIIFLETNLHI